MSATHLSVIDCRRQQRAAEAQETITQQLRLVRARKRPADVRCSIAHVRPNRVGAAADVVSERGGDDGRDGWQAVGQQQRAARELGERKAAAVPRGVALWFVFDVLAVLGEAGCAHFGSALLT